MSVKNAVHIDLFKVQQAAPAGTFVKVYRWVEAARSSGISEEHSDGLAWTVTVRLPDADEALFARDHMIDFGVPRTCLKLVPS